MKAVTYHSSRSTFFFFYVSLETYFKQNQVYFRKENLILLYTGKSIIPLTFFFPIAYIFYVFHGKRGI